MELSQAREIFRDFLKVEKNRITPERFEVLDAAVEYRGHFGADDLFIRMKNGSSHVSRATVYNTLELLSRCGLLTKRNFGENLNRYESNVNRESHDHLICIRCGKIIEFSSDKLKNTMSEIAEKYDFDITGFTFNLYGRCADNNKCNRGNV